MQERTDLLLAVLSQDDEFAKLGNGWRWVDLEGLLANKAEDMSQGAMEGRLCFLGKTCERNKTNLQQSVRSLLIGWRMKKTLYHYSIIIAIGCFWLMVENSFHASAYSSSVTKMTTLCHTNTKQTTHRSFGSVWPTRNKVSTRDFTLGDVSETP